MRERQQFYRAFALRPGNPGANMAISFRADNLQLAHDHAAHCCRCERPELELVGVRYIGREEPTTPDFGHFKEIAP